MTKACSAESGDIGEEGGITASSSGIDADMAFKVQVRPQITVTDDSTNTLRQRDTKRTQVLFTEPRDNGIDVCQVSEVLGWKNTGNIGSVRANGDGPATSSPDGPSLRC